MKKMTVTQSLTNLPSCSLFFHSPPFPKPSRTRLFLKPQASSSSPSLSSPPSIHSSASKTTGVVVVGAGLAGLAAATRLAAADVPFVVIETSDSPGGRVRTDTVDGFLLDRGFQIFITAYPEAKSLLDYQALDLRRFYSGARIFFSGEFHTVADPVRHLLDALRSLANPIGSVRDKFLIAATRLRVLTKPDAELLNAPEVPTFDLLRRSGFSDAIIARFFRPFFGGIFFDTELETTSRLFDFIFKCLALGDNALPASGIGAIPAQLAAKLPAGSVLYNSRAVEIESDGLDSPAVRLHTGEIVKSELGVILAVDQPSAEKIQIQGLEFNQPAQIKKPARSTVCLYFSSDRQKIPVRDPVLFLNGSGQGIVNNMFFATNVAPTYGPPDKALISVSLIGGFDDVADRDLTAQVRRDISEWFKDADVAAWKHLRTYRIKYAQPNQSPPTDLMKDPKVGPPGLYQCGDHLVSATFDGALVSGRLAAETLLRDRAIGRT